MTTNGQDQPNADATAPRDARSSAEMALRRQAEATAHANTTGSQNRLGSLSFEQVQTMLHELRVHQIELEMQNEELRRTQLELDAARARYFDLYDLAPVGYCTLDAQGLMLQTNLAGATLLGVSRQTLIGQAFVRFIFHVDQDIYYLYRKQLRETGQAPHCELRMKKSDGGFFWVHLTAVAAQEGDGAPVLRVVLSDITPQKLAQAELRIAATAFESQEGIFITDVAGVILRVNQAFTTLTDYSAKDVIGQTPRILSSGRHDAAFYTAMWDRIVATGSWQGEVWDRRKGGAVFPAWVTITAVKDEAGLATHYIASFTDITLRKTAEDQIIRLAFYDPLTGLPNRRLLMDRLKQALAGNERHRRQGALMFVDLDNFKAINDTLGHSQGDLLLQLVAERLSTCIRDSDSVARLGGDEFVVMLEDLSENALDAAAQAEAVGEKVRAALNLPYQLASQSCRCTPSIGVTLFADQQMSIDELMKRADLAMYQAKTAGRNTLRFFDPQMQAVVTARVELEAGLREALREGQLLLHYQPQVTGPGHLKGVEALVRWQHPQRGLVSPAEFIPLAEDTGLILPLGQWVLETACTQLAAWALQPAMAHLTMAVNVSARQFHEGHFVEQVLAALSRSGARPQRLKLELTEGLLIDNLEDVITKMNALKKQGISFSLDDFGTGYSSLSYLKRLPLDQLKIDQSFVRDLLTDPSDAVIARAIVVLGHSLGLQVIAEGVETAAQFDALARMGCDAYQGYYFGHPVAASGYTDFS